jgi:hypothetical protein
VCSLSISKLEKTGQQKKITTETTFVVAIAYLHYTSKTIRAFGANTSTTKQTKRKQHNLHACTGEDV